MATDKRATMDNHATVEAFSLGSVPVMTSCNSRGSEAAFSLGSVHGLYSSGSYEYGTEFRRVTSKYSARAEVFREELQANGSCDIGRQATSEDTV
jgi:hypothetical protein